MIKLSELKDILSSKFNIFKTSQSNESILSRLESTVNEAKQANTHIDLIKALHKYIDYMQYLLDEGQLKPVFR